MYAFWKRTDFNNYAKKRGCRKSVKNAKSDSPAVILKTVVSFWLYLRCKRKVLQFRTQRTEQVITQLRAVCAFFTAPKIYSATAEAYNNSKRDKDYPKIAVVKSVA